MREGARESRAIGGEFVHVRRAGVGIAVAAQFRSEILADDPDDVRALCSQGGGDATEKNEQRCNRAEYTMEHGLFIAEMPDGLN